MLLSLGSEWLFSDSFLASVNQFIADNQSNTSPVLSLISALSLSLGLLIATVSYLGMLWLQNWARYSFILSYLLMLPAYFFSGVYVSSGAGQFVYDLSSMFSGALVVVIFYTPVQYFFAPQTST